MEKISGLASVPAFVSLALVDLAKFSEVAKFVTLLLGCAISLVMFAYWCIRVKKEWTSERIAELKLRKAEKSRNEEDPD